MNSFNAIYTRKNTNEDGDIELTFTIKGYADREIIKELTKDTLYRLKLNEVKSKRTLQQNSYLWAIIHEIAEVDNGERANSDDDWDIYIEALERANAKFEYVQVRAEGEPILKQHFRAMKEMNRFVNEKGNEIVSYKVFYGSSKLDTKEMALLIDTVLDMASERGIPIIDWSYE